MSTENVFSYDEVPYQSVALVETHPDRMAAIATLFGMTPARLDSCRVLELGCAGGGNLAPMAQAMPGASFVGVDLSARQIEEAKELARAVGVSNVEYKVASVTEIGPDLGEFDYIIAHGIYSWVPDPVKAAILRVCRENLAPNGVAYVSYNTYPGWHVPGMVREMMIYHTRRFTDPGDRVRAARSFLDFLADSVPDKESHYARILRDEATQLKPHADSYVLHEHLEDLNHPLYFGEFAERAAQHDLKVLGDARYWSMAAAVQPPMAALLDRVAKEPIEREQYFDFLCNRRFRRTLLCRAEAATRSTPSLESLKTLRSSALVGPAVVINDFSSKTTVEFKGSDNTVRLSTSEPPFKAALLILAESLPHSIPFDALWAKVRHRLGRVGIEAGNSSDLLAARLLQAYGANSLELHTFEPSLPSEPDDRPRALPTARLIAEKNPGVPNLRHRLTSLSEFDRLVLLQLDGERDRSAILDRLVAAVAEGKFHISQNGVPIRDEPTSRPILERSLAPSLHRLFRLGLLA